MSVCVSPLSSPTDRTHIGIVCSSSNIMADINNDIFQAQPRFPPPSSSANKRLGKPPTRLQNKAPKALDLDQVVVRSGNSTPIPLLSPLVLSPASYEPAAAAVHDQFVFPVVSGSEVGNEMREVDHDVQLSQRENNDLTMESSGYNTEASSLFMFFQNQCAIVNQAQ
ncbi:hypothetical protein LINPERPRIM_LOCUS18138 [Linum perenne]